MTLGGISLRASADKSMVLSLPIWTAFPPILLSLALLGRRERLRVLARFQGGGSVTGPELGAAGFVILLILLALRIPIAVGLMVVGLTGYSLINGVGPLLNYLKTAPFWTYHVYDLSVVPLFMLMSQFATKAGLNAALFRAANLWLGHRRGGVAMATIGACAGFRRHLRVFDRDRRHHGARGAARTPPLPLFRRACDRERWLRAAHSGS